MGNSIRKQKPDTIIPVVQVSIKMLGSQPKKSHSNPTNTVSSSQKSMDSKTYFVPMISTRLCGKILKNCSKEQLCTMEDVDSLKEYLASDFNKYKCDLSKKKFIRRSLSTKTELDRFLKQRENEFIQMMDKDKYPHKTLSHSANNDLRSVLRHLNSNIVSSKFSISYHLLKFRTPEKPKLVNEIIRPRLEDAYMTNQYRSRYGKHVTYSILEKYNDIIQKFEEIFVKQKLTASNLRRNTSKMANGTGVDRAHKVSLQLAVVLWKKVYGHDRAYARVRVQLRQALSLPSNIYLTCHHTNRVLHVEYDKQIIDALHESNKQYSFSPGAKQRLKQVIDTLVKLKEHSDVMNDFANRSITVLKSLS